MNHKEEINCSCDNPEPDGRVIVGKAEGAYERCRNCGNRIWH